MGLKYYRNAVLVAAVLGLCMTGSASAKQAIRFGTSSIGSVYYIIAAGMADLIGKTTDINATVESVGGSDANIFAFAAHKVDLALANAGAAYRGYHGQKPFGKKVQVRLIAQGPESYRPIVIRRDADIKKPSDLIGRPFVGIRPAFVDVGQVARAFVAATGLPKNGIHFVSAVGSRDVVKDLRTGTVVGAVFPASRGNPQLGKLFHDKIVDFLYLPKATMQTMLDKLPPLFDMGELPAGTYEGQSQTLWVPAMSNYLVAAAGVSDDIVYKVTKALFDHHKEFSTYHATAKAWTLHHALDNPKIPYHPGAIRYFKEKGVWTAALAAEQKKLLHR